VTWFRGALQHCPVIASEKPFDLGIILTPPSFTGIDYPTVVVSVATCVEYLEYWGHDETWDAREFGAKKLKWYYYRVLPI
jgi:hypothetical protein